MGGDESMASLFGQPEEGRGGEGAGREQEQACPGGARETERRRRTGQVAALG